MLSIDASDPDFIRFRAERVLGREDYLKFESGFEDELRHRGKPARLLLDLRGFQGWTAAGLVRDLIFDLRHRRSFSKIAALGDARRHAWITALGALLFRARIRFFGVSEEEAIKWLRE